MSVSSHAGRAHRLTEGHWPDDLPDRSYHRPNAIGFQLLGIGALLMDIASLTSPLRRIHRNHVSGVHHLQTLKIDGDLV